MTDFETFHLSKPKAAKDVHASAPSVALSINFDAMPGHGERNRLSPVPYHAFDNVRSSTSFQPSDSTALSTGLPPPPRRNVKQWPPRSSSLAPTATGKVATRSPGVSDPLFPFSDSGVSQPAASIPFINAVPQLTRIGGLDGQNQGLDTSPTTPAIRGIGPLDTDHDLFISFRSRGAPTSTAYSMPRMDKLAGKAKDPSGQINSQLHSKKEGFSPIFTGQSFKFPNDNSPVAYGKTLPGSDNPTENSETSYLRLLAALSQPADEPTALSESKPLSQHSSYSPEPPVAISTPQPINAYAINRSLYRSDSPINGPNDPYGNHVSSSCTSPSSESSISSTSSSPIFATSFDRSLTSSPTDVSRLALHQSGARLGTTSRYATYRAMSSSPKPPLPTTPKPNFRRATSANPPLKERSHKTAPNAVDEKLNSMSPTINLRDPQERADLVKKNRKLAQMFGTTPGAMVLPQKYDETPANPSALKASWLTPGEHLIGGRRHSVPFSPDVAEDHSLLRNAGPGNLASNRASVRKGHYFNSSSTDLSHEGSINTPAIFSSYSESRRLGFQHSSSTPSLSETSTAAEQEEADRKRKRDQLAKLHRFLGSRVPVGLVLGLEPGDVSLPPPALRAPDSGSRPASRNTESRKHWLARRRSSSVEMYPASSHDVVDRLKEDLSDEEKAINVRRAQKMEKVFGVQPPQILYHTRCSPSPSPIHLPTSPVSPSFGRWTAPPSPISQSRNQSFERNPNQSAYKSKSRKHERPTTPESMQQLLPGRSRDSFYFDSQNLAVPSVYTHYQHSLHSLNDIIDRDDRVSLVELHQYLRGEVPDPSQEFEHTAERSGLIPGSATMGRRRSLPSPALAASVAEPTAKPEATDFQLRRRRAAKLTQFFGVDYKQIIYDVLESIEKGVEEERKRGALQPEEAQVLLQKVDTLKRKRSAIL